MNPRTLPKPPQPETLTEAWKNYRVYVIPPDAYPEQLEQLRDAFHAGAYEMMRLMVAAGRLTPEGDADARIAALHDEVQEYVNRRAEQSRREADAAARKGDGA